MIDPLFSLSGFLVGMLVGMTGVGGGSLMTPLLILLFGVHPATAVGTDLIYAAATKTGGSLVHGLARSIDWTVVRRLATGSIPGTALTLLVLSQFNLRQSGRAQRDHDGAMRRAVRERLGARVRRPDREALSHPYRCAFRRADGVRHHGRRLGARDRGFDLVGWRGRNRRDGAAAALSENADGEDRRLRYRACGAADAACRLRACGHRHDRLAHHRVAARRFVARASCSAVCSPCAFRNAR